MALRAGPGRNLRSVGVLAATVVLGAAAAASGQSRLPSLDPERLATDPSAAGRASDTIAGGAAGPADDAGEVTGLRPTAGGATTPSAGGALAPSAGSGGASRSGKAPRLTARPSAGARRVAGSGARVTGATRSGEAARDATAPAAPADRTAAAARSKAAARRAAARRASRRSTRQGVGGTGSRRAPSPARVPDRPAAGPADHDEALRAAAGALALVALSSLVLLRTVARLHREAHVR